MKKVLRRYMAASLLFAALLAAAGTGFGSTQPYISSHQINFGTGNKYLSATDVRVAGPGARLAFTRTYNSQSTDTSKVGYGWSSSLSEKLVIETGKITLIQSGGRYVHFIDDGAGNYINETGGRRVITAVSGGYQLQEVSGGSKNYDTAGKITSYTDRNR